MATKKQAHKFPTHSTPSLSGVALVCCHQVFRDKGLICALPVDSGLTIASFASSALKWVPKFCWNIAPVRITASCFRSFCSSVLVIHLASNTRACSRSRVLCDRFGARKHERQSRIDIWQGETHCQSVTCPVPCRFS